MELAGYGLLIMAAASFMTAALLFFTRRSDAVKPPPMRESALTDLEKALQAVTKLVDSLTRAGPAIGLLAASIVFAVLGVMLLVLGDESGRIQAARSLVVSAGPL